MNPKEERKGKKTVDEPRIREVGQCSSSRHPGSELGCRDFKMDSPCLFGGGPSRTMHTTTDLLQNFSTTWKQAGFLERLELPGAGSLGSISHT